MIMDWCPHTWLVTDSSCPFHQFSVSLKRNIQIKRGGLPTSPRAPWGVTVRTGSPMPTLLLVLLHLFGSLELRIVNGLVCALGSYAEN